MEAAPLISIITPTYNHESYVGACIESALRQTYGRWEQVVIDDGSTDATGEIARSYRDSRIRYLRQDNRGPFELAKTYNRALSLCKGELIAILEGDDLWPPDKLATLMPAFQDPSIVLAYGEREDLDAQGRKQRRKIESARCRDHLAGAVLENRPIGSTTRYMLFEQGRSLVHPCTVILRRSALEQIGGFQYVDGLPLTDFPTFLELSLKGPFWFTRKCMGYLRRHEQSVTVRHLRAIHDAVSRYAEEFIARHERTLGLTDWDRRAIKASWSAVNDRIHFSEGRLLLLQKQWAGARAHFRAASESPNATVRVAAAAGWLLSLVHQDMEMLMRIGGRSDLRLASGER